MSQSKLKTPFVVITFLRRETTPFVAITFLRRLLNCAIRAPLLDFSPMQPRRSSRETTTPLRFGYQGTSSERPLSAAKESPDTVLPTIETSTPTSYVKKEVSLPPIPDSSSASLADSDSNIQEFEDSAETHTEEMSVPSFTEVQKAVMDAMIKAAVTAALDADAAASRHGRALTADLQPPAGHYIPVLDPTITMVEEHKVKYPRLHFSDHDSEVEYDSWKMDMKLFIEAYSGNFRTGQSQINAYFKCTGGEAKTIILQHMGPDFANEFNNAEDVLTALDQRFFDHNRVQTAKASYYSHSMTKNMTYDKFRILFTKYAIAGNIPRARWFEDVCEKVSPALKNDIRTKKYELDNDYARLDEFLAVSDREARNIAAEVRALEAKKVAPMVPAKPSGLFVRKETPVAPAARVFGAPLASPVVPTPLDPDACRLCRKKGHWARDCPSAAKIAELTGVSIEALKLSAEDAEEMETDEMSGNC